MKSLRLLIKYIKGKELMIVALILSFICYVSSVSFIPLFTGKCIDEIEEVIRGVAGSIEQTNFYNYLVTIIVLTVSSFIFNFSSDLLASNLTEKISKSIKDELFSKINNLSISFIDSHPHGDLVSRVISDVDNVNSGLQSGFKQFVQGILQIALTLVVMFTLNWILGLIIVVLTPISFLISFMVVKTSNKYFKKQAASSGEIGALVLETTSNLDLIRGYQLGERLFDKFVEIDANLYKNGQKAQFSSSFTNPSTRLINNSTVAIVALVASLLCAYSWNSGNVVLGASCSIGTIVTFIQFANQFAKPLNDISSCLAEIQNGIASLNRIEEIIEIKDISNLESSNVIDLKEIETIKFENVDFSYVKGIKVLKNLNFSINKNQKVAIVGASGCGKTTIINLLLKFYDYDKGKILINGIDLKSIDKDELRNHFTMVLQDTWIFSGTILENIKVGNKNASKEEVIKACKEANCYDFIKQLPDGFNTKISANSGLSQGQKQLICIARAFLNLKEFVILDEATSNVDARTELLISNAFNRITSDRTSIVIAHRLFTIKHSDFIIVMDKGNIVEIGNHAELLAKKGYYFDLYNAQYKEE